MIGSYVCKDWTNPQKQLQCQSHHSTLAPFQLDPALKIERCFFKMLMKEMKCKIQASSTWLQDVKERLEQNPYRQLLMASKAFAKFLFKISLDEKQSQVSSKEEISASCTSSPSCTCTSVNTSTSSPFPVLSIFFIHFLS